MNRVEQVTGKPAHPFLKRRIFFAHRELKEILDCYEKKIPFYLYTGRVSASTCLMLLTHLNASSLITKDTAPLSCSPHVLHGKLCMMQHLVTERAC